MNLDRIKKAVNERVRLRPLVIPLDEHGRGLPATDDAWLIDSVSDEDVGVSNSRTGHFTLLGRDHIHHYTTNPDETRRAGVPHGFFTLNVQIYVQGPALSITPTARPDEPVAPREPTILALQVDLSYPAHSGLQSRLQDSGFRVVWARESRAQRLVDLEGWSIVLDRRADGRSVTFRLKDKPEDQILLKRAASESSPGRR